ncbi:MAG: sugar phosphate nucleotidyltransferase [Chloroflexi bacterium]|nr:sugar phosphate nucleotidyltransferase [Chloroflexota bacterium]MCL5075624.1 sugar phosphate nucleotidyltransferase [Chloroflexota bacterium]
MTRVVGLIPAAGQGTRLAPFPWYKELFPIGYQDMLVNGCMQRRPKVVGQYLIDNMIRAGVRKIFFILGEGKHDIMRYYGNGQRFGIDIAYLFQEQLTGLPAALDLARNWLTDETVIFGMPDTIIQPANAFIQLLDAHEHGTAAVTLGVFKTNTPAKFGMVEIAPDGMAVGFVDKPAHTSLKYMWGVGCWSRAFTELMGAFLTENPYQGKEIILSDVFQRVVESGLRIQTVRFDEGIYIDVGTPEGLNQAIEEFGSTM